MLNQKYDGLIVELAPKLLRKRIFFISVLIFNICLLFAVCIGLFVILLSQISSFSHFNRALICLS